MKMAMWCLTLNRPHLLQRVIDCFFAQTHPDKELIILDDAGQYDQLEGPGWRLVSFRRRFRTTGEKCNAAIALTSPDVQGFLKADDDDYHFPWALSAMAHALTKHPWVQPREAMEVKDGHLKRYKVYRPEAPELIAYAGQIGFTREAFKAAKGYPCSNLEELPLNDALRALYGPSGCTICAKFPLPFYVYTDRFQESFHANYDANWNVTETEESRLAVPSGPYVGKPYPVKPFPFTEADIPEEVLPRWF